MRRSHAGRRANWCLRHLEQLITLEHRGRSVSLLAAPAGAKPAVRPLRVTHARPRPELRGVAGLPDGDDIRSIDWLVTARLHRTSGVHEERDRPGLLVVDQRLSMFFGSRRAMKSVTAAEAAVVFAWRVLNWATGSAAWCSTTAT